MMMLYAIKDKGEDMPDVASLDYGGLYMLLVWETKEEAQAYASDQEEVVPIWIGEPLRR